jgi:hypothetical protein
MACCERSRHRLAGHTCSGPFLHSSHDLYPFDFFLESGKVIDIRFEGIKNVCWLSLLPLLPDESFFLSIGMHTPLFYVINQIL